MPPLQFCANLTWLFTELPELSQRIYAAAAAGFRAVEAAWPYDEELLELQRARDATGVEMVLINTPPGNLRAGDLGLGAVPGREQEFRQGLEQAVQYAQALQCKRIHLMAGRVPLGSNRADVAQDMERIFIQNLTYAADLLSKKGITGLIEPINTRITDPAYFLDSPHHGCVPLADHGWEPDSEHPQIFPSHRSCPGRSGAGAERARHSRRAQLQLPVGRPGAPSLPGLCGLRVPPSGGHCSWTGLAEGVLDPERSS
ncbi:putative hydroxypyruvate isomerase isoform X2 [Eucyclogobius newberryi]|uniref:putative hydroxypyruvate isomerase isoform X2 n=1 Tax=Eucyclogobius newberryi TaxID=166745 RepID=UPI003B5B5424